MRVASIDGLRRLRAVIGDHVRPWRMAFGEAVKDVSTRGRALLRPSLRRAASKAAGAGRQHILMVDDLVPDPRFGAGYPRAFAIAHALVKAGHGLTFYPMRSTPADLARMKRAFAGAVRFLPGEGARGLRRLLWREGEAFDLLLVSRPTPMQAFVEARWRPQRAVAAPFVVYDAEAVLSPREARRRALFGPAWSEREQAAALVAELEPARQADLITAVGGRDAAVIRTVLATPVLILSHAVEAIAGAAPFAEREDFLFVGRMTGTSAEASNVDAVLWFVKQVMPLLDELIGADYQLQVAGLVDAPEFDELPPGRVVLHGVVEELDRLYERSRVFVAPARFAAGIPLKVVEAMGRAIPCVATPILAEQLAAGSDELPSGASPRDFAEQCRRLYTDPAAWSAVRAGGLRLVSRSFSQDAFDRALADVLAHASGRQVRRGDR